MARGLEPAGVEFIAENLDSYIRDLGKADKAQQGLGDSAEKSSKGLNILGGVVTGVAMAVTTFAIDAVAKASQALVGLAQDSIGVATEFESSMAVLKISASGVEEELANLGFGMEDLSEVALAVGGDTRLLGVSASGSAEAITGLFKAGLTAQDVFGDLQGYMAGTADLSGALRASIDLAAATTLDMVQASDLAAIALSTFGGQAEEAGMTADEFVVMAMDNLVRAADASVAEVEGLAEALKMVGPTAGAMSISIQDTNNALALLSTRGIQGSMAGTSLNRMLLDLGKTTPQATEMMESLGIATYDEQGAMLPLVDIIGQFEIALGDATDAERDAALQAIFTAQGMRSMNVLMGEGIEGWQGMEEAIGSAATMQEQGEARSQTLAAQMEALDGVMETLKIRIGSALLPALTNMAQIFSGLIDEHGPLLASVFETIGQVASEVVEILGELASGDIGLLDLIPDTSPVMKLLDAFKKVGSWFDKNGPAIDSALNQIGLTFQAVFGSIWQVIQDSVVPALQEVWAVFQETWDVVRDVLGEFGLEFDDTGSGIETVTGIIIGAIQLWGGYISGVLTAVSGTVKFFAEHFKGVWEGIRDVVQGVKEWFEGFKEFWVALFDGDMPKALKGLEKSFKGTAKFIKGIVKVIVKSITMPFKGLYKLIEGFVKGVIKFFKNLKQKLVGGSIIPDMMDKIEKVIDVVLGAILKVWEKVFEKILDTTQEIFASIERTVDRVMTAVEKIIDTITTAIGGDWEDFVELLFELWEDTWDDIRDAVDTIFSAIEDLIDQIAGSIESLWDSFTETLEEVWTNAWDTIQSTVDTILSAIEGLISGISDSITSAWESFTSSIQSTWETVWGAIQSFVDTTFNAIEGLIDSVSDSIGAAWGTFTSAIQAAWETTWNAIETFVNTVFGNVQTAISTISGAIEGTWNSWIGRLRSAFETMFNALSGVVTTAMNAVSTAVSSALSALAGILAIGGALYNGIMTIGHNIAGAIKDGVVALWDVVTGAIKTKLEALGAVGTFGLDVWQKVQDLGKKIVNMIKSGLTYLWDAATGLVGAIETKLEGLLDAIGVGTWNTVKEVGGRILSKIMDGVKAGTAWASNFWNWLWGEILDWLSWHGSSSSVGEQSGSRVGTGIMDGLVSSVYSQSGRFTDALSYVMGQASGGWTGTAMMQAAAGFSAPLGMTAPAMTASAAAPRSAEVSIGPNYINDGMDLAEFEVRVRQAVSEAI